MNNLKKFQQFNESKLNEGLISWMGRMFRPNELDGNFKIMVKYIKDTFEMKNLEYKKQQGYGGYFENFIYTTNSPMSNRQDKIELKSETLAIKINDVNVTEFIDDYYIKDLLKFFRQRVQNQEQEEFDLNRKQKIYDMRRTLNDYECEDEEDCSS